MQLNEQYEKMTREKNIQNKHIHIEMKKKLQIFGDGIRFGNK